MGYVLGIFNDDVGYNWMILGLSHSWDMYWMIKLYGFFNDNWMIFMIFTMVFIGVHDKLGLITPQEGRYRICFVCFRCFLMFIILAKYSDDKI